MDMVTAYQNDFLPKSGMAGTLENPMQDSDIENESESQILGYFINYGISSCRIFQILRDGKTLNQIQKIAYNKLLETYDLEEYLENIIEQTNETIIPIIGDNREGLFIKTFADNNFRDLMKDDDLFADFVMDFYQRTKLSFNILSDEQTENNIRAQFSAVSKDGVIINIGSTCVDIFARPERDRNFKLYSLQISLRQVRSYIEDCGIAEQWTENDINIIKNHIRSLIPSDFPKIRATNAYILKDEKTFMQSNGYRLSQSGNESYIKYTTYKKDNRSNLFCIDYLERLKQQQLSESEQSVRYGFKIGHIILETLFENMGIKNIYPSDLHSIHGNADAYLFNVVIGGSASPEHEDNMVEACRLFEKMGATVISPILLDGHLKDQNQQTHNDHIKALRKCDLLFISNKDDYFGEQTCYQIYAAYYDYKPIAFWKEPSLEHLEERKLAYIPHECWENKMSVLDD